MSYIEREYLDKYGGDKYLAGLALALAFAADDPLQFKKGYGLEAAVLAAQKVLGLEKQVTYEIWAALRNSSVEELEKEVASRS